MVVLFHLWGKIGFTPKKLRGEDVHAFFELEQELLQKIIENTEKGDASWQTVRESLDTSEPLLR